MTIYIGADINYYNVILTDSATGNSVALTGTMTASYDDTNYSNSTMTGTITETFYNSSNVVQGTDTITSSSFGYQGWATGAAGTFHNGNGDVFNYTYTGQVPQSFLSLGTYLQSNFFTPNEQFLLTANQLNSTGIVCYALGTLIRTPHGDVRIERLQPGDKVLTASGEIRPVKWIGRRKFRRDFASTPRYDTVRIVADAFGPNRPSQDLVVSVKHAICLDLIGETLVVAEKLVNGATVRREKVDQVTWHHVELDSHDIVLANNLPAETYIDMGNRGFFDEAGATLDSLEVAKGRTHDDFCRPMTWDGRTLDFVRERLLERARALGWAQREEAKTLRLLVDGVEHLPEARNGEATFVLPAGATDVRLISDTHEPAALGFDDRRTLGVCVRGLTFASADGETRAVAADDARLRNGAHPAEGNQAARWRWTNGELVLDPALWEGLAGPLSLTVRHAGTIVRRWTPPAGEPAREAPGRPMLRVVA